MSDIITALTSLFTFLTTQLGNVATFFTTSDLGLLILGISIFVLVVNVVLSLISKVRGK